MTASDPKEKQEKPTKTTLHAVDAMWEEEALWEIEKGEGYEEIGAGIEAEKAGEMAGLLRHSALPATLSKEAFARIGDALFGSALAIPIERILESSVSSADRLRVVEAAYVEKKADTENRAEWWWSRWVSWLQQASVWRPVSAWRPVWGLAALGCVMWAVAGVWNIEKPPSSRLTKVEISAAAQGPWPNGVDPFAVTRDASERLGHVLRYYREQRQDQWIEDLGASNVR